MASLWLSLQDPRCAPHEDHGQQQRTGGAKPRRLGTVISFRREYSDKAPDQRQRVRECIAPQQDEDRDGGGDGEGGDRPPCRDSVLHEAFGREFVTALSAVAIVSQPASRANGVTTNAASRRRIVAEDDTRGTMSASAASAMSATVAQRQSAPAATSQAPIASIESADGQPKRRKTLSPAQPGMSW